ncbi:MAG: hypothetical protein M1134_03460 [Actinobacteria bacterium]|nr:hypothetical protein [Actinomycetota bacterium]
MGAPEVVEETSTLGVNRSLGPIGSNRLSRWVNKHIAPLIATALLVVLGMNFTIWWAIEVKHEISQWLTPPDLWGSYLGSVALVHGHLTQIYSGVTGLVSLPGIVYVLAPVAAVGSALHLGVSQQFVGGYTEPTAWVILGPYEMILGSIALFAADSVAQRFGVSLSKRILLALVGAAIISNVLIRWGHPEDCIAVGLSLYAALAAHDSKWTRCGWLLGVAIAFQPLAILALPAILATASLRRLIKLVLPILVPSVIAVAGPLIASPHFTFHALTNQLNYPTLNHPTPWVSLLPHTYVYHVLAVPSGPLRAVAVVTSAALSVAVCRKSKRFEVVVFMIAVSFALRVVFEPALDAFYVWPALEVALVLSCRRNWIVATVAGAAAVGATWWSDVNMAGVWPWWIAMCAILLALLVLAYPLRAPVNAEDHPGKKGPLDLNGEEDRTGQSTDLTAGRQDVALQ